MQLNQRSEESLLEIPYSVFAITKGQDRMQTLQEVATAINVQLKLDEQDVIPFGEPAAFKLAASQDKLFAYGPGGSGKSRLIFELLKSKLDAKIERLYIINPRQSFDRNTNRVNLMQLASQFRSGDFVLWDNFPDGLMKKDTDAGRLALEILSSGEATNLFIALKPKFLEIYREIAKDIPDLYAYQVRYDIEQFREIIKLYGTRIARFKELFSKYIANNITQISKLLWQKEPFPLTIFNYYRELAAKCNSGEQHLDAIAEAQVMLYPTTYYEHQFEQLVYSGVRLSDVEFLYTVKLCYELVLDRRMQFVEHLQPQIFGTSAPKDISRNLGSWVYLSGRHVSMHDVPRDAIKFNDQTKARIIDYTITNFSDLVTDSGEQLDFVGMFLGKNIQLLVQQKDRGGFLPDSIFQFMKSHRRLEVAIGRGAGEVYYSLDSTLQLEILDRIEKDAEFSRGLGESLGKRFEGLDENIRADILSKRIGKGILFARGLGESLGYNLFELPEPIQDQIFQISLNEKNYNFQRGIGTGLGRKFRHLEEHVQKLLLELTSQHIALAIGVGYGLALDYTSSSFSREFQADMMELVKENGEIARGLGMGLGQNFPFLNNNIQNQILDWTANDPRLEFGFAYQLSFSFGSLSRENQDLIFRKIEKNTEFSYGAGWGFGVVFTYLMTDRQQQLLDLAKKNARFAMGLGAGIGNQLQYLTEKEEQQLFAVIENNEWFTTGAAFGIGRSFNVLSQELQDKVWQRMQKDHTFAVGLGWGLGFTFSYLHEGMQDKVLDYIQKEPGFAYGFGWGWGFMFTYLSSELQQKANLLALQNSQFACGLGLGLGTLFKYLTAGLQQEILARTESNPQFATGLGTGLGYLFDYISVELQQEILSRSDYNPCIAKGLGIGLGNNFAFMPHDRQRYLLQKAQLNPELMEGLGQGIGRVFVYMSAERQKNALRMASVSVPFAIGLGGALGQGFQHLEGQLREQVTKLSQENDAFAIGLASGLGRIIGYLETESAERVWRRTEEDAHFAVGLGMGIGKTIDFFPISFQDKVFDKVEQNGAQARGFGMGLANCTSFYLTENNDHLSDKALALAKKDGNFGRGYGEGFGRACNFWTRTMLNDVIMANMTGNMQFAIGLGEGVGQSLPYAWRFVTDKDIEGAGMEKLIVFDSFQYGLGLGFSRIIEFIPEEVKTSILQALSKYQNFVFGLGYGLGFCFSELSQNLQEDSLAVAGKEKPFASGLGKGIGSSFKYFEPVMQQGLLLFAEKNYEFEVGLGYGVASIFPSLSPSLQEEMIDLAEKRKGFAEGLYQGLSRTFSYLGEALLNRLGSSARMRELFNSRQDAQTSDSIAEFAHHEDDSLMLLNRPARHAKLEEGSSSKESLIETEILFSGRREKYCICYIDMMNSTKISATLDDSQLSRYYSIFLNSMATIAKNFGATIIKNAGDCLIYYFPTTADSRRQDAFRDVIECGTTMISAHQAINSRLFEQRLPPLDYRISSDYGKVEVAQSSSSQSEDLFGSTMNVCAKINSKAPANGMVIGNDLYQMVGSSIARDYDFERIGEYSGFKEAYPIYLIKSKKKRNILNPFKRQAETILDSSFHKDTEGNGDREPS